jgi:hypothetical protein
MNWNGTVSLLLACIEFILLVNVLVFTKTGKFRNIAVLMIALLAVYQLLEFLMCNIELRNPVFPYIAFFNISFLPPLNLLLVLNLTRNPTLNLSRIGKLIFLPAIFFIIYYTFIIPQFEVTSCTVLYATYHFPLGDLYGMFYYLPIAVSIILLIIDLRKEKDHKSKLALKVLLFGGIFISVPVVIGFTLILWDSYGLISAMESIMCKFAFVYAVCLSFVCIYSSRT